MKPIAKRYIVYDVETSFYLMHKGRPCIYADIFKAMEVAKKIRNTGVKREYGIRELKFSEADYD